MKTFLKKILLLAAVVIIAVWLVSLNAGPKNIHPDYGVTFSYPYAQSLGLDWKQAYTASLSDLHIKLLRLSAYWDSVEPNQNQYSYDDLDFQLLQANQFGAKVILAVGKRLPRWPECHVPGWADKLSQSGQDEALLSYIEKTVTKYANNPAVATWQVENEPFLGSFGPCPSLEVSFFDKEIALVKRLDPSRPILITDSGELSSWTRAGNRGDMFGTTYYRYIYSDKLKRYWTNFYFPAWFYRFKGGIVRLLNPGKQIIIAELEAEPWTTRGILSTPIDEQFKTMSLNNFKTITRLAAQTGYSPQYLWGVEWWYWMKTQGHPEFWEQAKQLINH